MTEIVSITALLTPYQAFQVSRWHKQNLETLNIPIKDNLNIRPECFLKFSDWSPPEPEEIRELLGATGLTQKQASEYVGLRDNNGRAFRRYIRGESTIPYAHWVMLCMYIGIERFW